MNTKAVYRHEDHLIKLSKIARRNTEYKSLRDLFMSTYIMSPYIELSTSINMTGILNMLESNISKRNIDIIIKSELFDILVMSSYPSFKKNFMAILDRIVLCNNADIIFNETAKTIDKFNYTNDFICSINSAISESNHSEFIKSEAKELFNLSIKNLFNNDTDYRKFIFNSNMKFDSNLIALL